LDVTQPASFKALHQLFGDQPLDLLVCNAGIFPGRDEVLTDGYPTDMWADVMATNVTGVFLSVQTFLPNLMAAQGKIAIISSQMGSSTKVGGGGYIYRASKAAVSNLGFNLAADLKSDGVAVGVYHPGWVRTDMGGDDAAVSPHDSAAGLIKRFDALSLDRSGCFETYDGTPHPA
jgi:NAD(P)-dependent dehydrogenase (short-subunit alcohol dehydrogenase family)